MRQRATHHFSLCAGHSLKTSRSKAQKSIRFSLHATHLRSFTALNIHISIFQHTFIMAPIGSVLLAPSPSSNVKYDLTYYLKAAAAGGICCSITHGALTPVDGTFAGGPAPTPDDFVVSQVSLF